MNLRSWTSNCREFLNSIPEIDQSDLEVQKCLGLQWNVVSDTFNVSPISLTKEDINTKRSVLQVLASFYDPLGFHAPVIVRAKCLIQAIWKEGFDWDDPLPESYLTLWKEIAEDLNAACTIKVPRHIDLIDDSGSTELHVFCDASQKAYATCAYVRHTSASQTVSHLIMCKTRVAPIKGKTIPRLELMAANIGTRLIRFIRVQLPIKFAHTCLWTDSTCVLGWVPSPVKKQPLFVENRLAEIPSEPDVVFRHIRSEENPAGLPSRGSSASTSGHELWWHGPARLLKPNNISAEPSVLVHGEGPADESHPPSTPAGIDPTQYSSFAKLLRVTAYVQRFIRCARTKSPIPAPLTVAEIERAKVEWLRYTQHNTF
ncbi:uncharacterized protein LOC135820247 [Sycon ciliatum]|uniref:uncharacterized protein LOC135820247 n=1 Tax=Sycon ciliatum TaxID=27933 RepID=UPI0031F69616